MNVIDDIIYDVNMEFTRKNVKKVSLRGTNYMKP